MSLFYGDLVKILLVTLGSKMSPILKELSVTFLLKDPGSISFLSSSIPVIVTPESAVA
jgi:hypothetical protein